MRHTIAGKSTVVGTTLRAGASLFATATIGGKVREVGVFNTTTTTFEASLVNFTTATNVGAGLTEANYDPANPASCTGFAGHTGDGGAGTQVYRHAPIGAAVGAGVIWTFGDSGILIPVGTANGIGIICPAGTGQIFTYHIDWDD